MLAFLVSLPLPTLKARQRERSARPFRRTSPHCRRCRGLHSPFAQACASPESRIEPMASRKWDSSAWALSSADGGASKRRPQPARTDAKEVVLGRVLVSKSDRAPFRVPSEKKNRITAAKRGKGRTLQVDSLVETAIEFHFAFHLTRNRPSFVRDAMKRNLK